MKKIFETTATCAMVFLVAVIWNGVFRITIREIKLDAMAEYSQAVKEYNQTLSESRELRIKHMEELQELAMIVLAGATPFERILVQLYLEQMATADQEMDEKLDKARRKICGLTSEKTGICQPWQSSRGWLI